MIAWPPLEVLNASARHGLQRFRETGACAEFEASSETWTVAAWPWNDECPVRVVLEDPSHNALVFTEGNDGLWVLTPAPVAVHTRSAEDLEKDAQGDTGERPLQPAHQT